MSGAVVAAMIMPKPAPVYVSAGAIASDLLLTLDVPYPSGIRAGDLLLVHAYATDSILTAGITTPSDFTEINKQTSTVISSAVAAIYSKIATGSESGSLPITCSGDSGRIGRMYLFRGNAAASFTEGAAGAITASSSASLAQPTLTTTGANRLALLFNAGFGTATFGDCSGETGGDFTELADADAIGLSMQLQSSAAPTATTISGGTTTASASLTFRARQVVALKPY